MMDKDKFTSLNFNCLSIFKRSFTVIFELIDYASFYFLGKLNTCYAGIVWITISVIV